MTMTPVERWILPDGIEEILPPEAQQMDALRRRLVDLFGRWGYELVIPPMMEFTDSLLVGLGEDVDLLTFKVTDRLSGRSMGIRADMTPQIARIDAHSLKREGINRLCYAGHVLQSTALDTLDTRSPMQVGVELFGDPSLEAEREIVSLLLDVLEHALVPQICLDLGHVGIYRALAQAAEFNQDQELEFFNLLQAKSLTEIRSWLDTYVKDAQMAHWLNELPRLCGAISVLTTARDVFKGAPAPVFSALDQLSAVAETLQQRFPDAQLYFDLSELSGYHYLTGVVFAAFAPGHGASIARGGRYDHIGEVFGRARSAAGFTVDLAALSRLGHFESTPSMAIFAPLSTKPEQWRAIQELRGQGERVVCAAGAQTEPQDYQNCDRRLVESNGTFQVLPI